MIIEGILKFSVARVGIFGVVGGNTVVLKLLGLDVGCRFESD